MSYAIASQNPNQPNLPILIFGTFKGDTLEQLKAGATHIYDAPIDDVEALGTDILPMFKAFNQSFEYADPNADFSLTVVGATQSSVAGITARDKTTGNGASLSPFPGTDNENVTRESSWLMYTEINGVFSPYLLTKWYDKRNGKLKNSVQGLGSTSRHWFDIVIRQFKEYTPYTPPEAGGGVGLADKTSDPVDFPALPLVSALGTGTVNMYRATQTSLKAFSQYLWTGDFVDNIKKLFQDPMEALISVQIVPYTPEHSDTLANVYLSWIDTGVQMYPITNQYIEIDCGTIAVGEYWGSALDYPPNTDISIFLPYIGMKSLSGQDVMGRTVHLKYHIDTLSGACVAMLKCSGRGLESVLYSWVGNCNTQIPISARDFSNVYTSAAAVSASAGIAAAKGGAALAAGVVVTSALHPASFDTQTRQNGSIGSTPSYLGIQTPFLCITRPIDSTPEGFNNLLGRPSNLGGKIGDYSGYLEVTATHIEGFPATEKEKNMISSILASGIII